MNLETLAELARSLPRAAFGAKFPHLFLVFRIDQGPSQPTGNFHTKVATPEESQRSAGGGMAVVPVSKAKDSPYSDRISVGRARNCDVVLRHESVSKLHAHVRQTGDAAWTLTDPGSQNGTEINGVKVRPGEAVAIANGYVVVFGSLLCRVVDGNDLHAVVLRLSAAKKP